MHGVPQTSVATYNYTTLCGPEGGGETALWQGFPLTRGSHERTEGWTMNANQALTEFQWVPEPKAEKLVRRLVNAFLSRSEFATTLRHRMHREAGVRFVDMVDHLVVPQTAELEHDLTATGFQRQTEPTEDVVHAQPDGIFPRVVLGPTTTGTRIALKVESVADFESVWQTDANVVGPPLSPLRSAKVWSSSQDELWIVERHGYPGFAEQLPPEAANVLLHADALRRRPRAVNEKHGFDAAEQLIDAAIRDLGVDYTCDLFFSIEREYWQRRNRAAQVQKARQDRLGLGWANHDHHTYRSSRKDFARLIGIFEKLGFHCRERFYAGREAGWGAQVLEQPHAGIVIFADVDLSPDELFADFAHEPLAERQELGTVGLWCGLHGESFLAAGMHHLECQFDFEALKDQLKAEAGVTVMKPFTDLPYLRQAFTEGERWPVSHERIKKLLAEGKISAEQAAGFEREGAIGSHLENLERNAGFKGFNQTGVSEIISATDPRKHLEGLSA